MEAYPMLRFPKPIMPPYETYGEFEIAAIDSDWVTFRRLNLGSRLFYECIHCGKCGCPSFPPESIHELPRDVIDHLSRHAEMCDPTVFAEIQL